VYSIENQGNLICKFAGEHGFKIIQSFEDRGRTGMTLKHRPGLQALLAEALQGNARFKAILVYDVSRWGRFQDCDEPGHYEFLCKQSGIDVHYCSEDFRNDGSIGSKVIKALKRAMAAEFSRESSWRVHRALLRTAEQGFKCSGTVRIGYRRLLVTQSRIPIRVLAEGEYNGTPGNRVIYCLGPEEEISCIRNMFEWASQGSKPAAIAAKLSQNGIRWLRGLPWNADRVRRTLRNPIYAGKVIFGKHTNLLRTPKRKQPQEQWTISDRTAPAIVSPELFAKVQNGLALRPPFKITDKQIVDRLQCLLRKNAKLSQRIIAASTRLPSPYLLKRRFGSLRQVYQLVGFHSEKRSCA